MRSIWKNYHLLLVKLALLLSVLTVHAQAFVELESRYEGDGWFRYKLKLPVDVYWAFSEIGSFGAPMSESTGESTIAPGWIMQSPGSVAYASTNLQARPTEYTFRFRSHLRHYKFQPVSSVITMSLIPQEWINRPGHGTYWSQNMVGFVLLDSLVPCTEAEADGSPAVFTKRFGFFPDVRIEETLIESNSITGLRISVPMDATFRVEGSTDLAAWNTVGVFSGAQGTNTIYVSDLASGGPFYRVSITSYNGHQLFSATPATDSGMKGRPVESARIKSDPKGLQVTFTSMKGEKYLLEFSDNKGNLLKSSEITAESEEASIAVPLGLSSSSVLVKVYQIVTASQ